MKVWLGLGTLIKLQILQLEHSTRLRQMTNGDRP
jgi:hypothetical protein